MDKLEEQRQILDADWRVAEQKEVVREAQTDLDDLIDAKPEKHAVDQLEQQLTVAKEKLKLALLIDGDVNNAKEHLAHQKAEMKLRKEILSTLLVHYVANHRVQSIEVDQQNHQINITAKVGKKISEQMELPL